MTVERIASAALGAGALVFGLAGCTGQLELANTFTDAAEDRGYNCTDTVPSDDAVREMVTCQSSDGRVLLVTFDDGTALRASEGAFTSGGSEAQSSVVYGDRWVVVGSNDSDVTELAETLK
ncbi:hypothetical protein [Cryobacterium zongtaii]|uniref:hypothetical protein n=1 Tax=Cryobacterium zongtaii TaxID=1259217 RepID=UPI00105751BD|nr:hypothetical protein [Cryobacterium zongtaii]